MDRAPRAGEAAIAYETLRQIPRATSILLFAVAGTQVLACITGISGIKWLHRECICTAMLVLALATAALGWVSGATYLWLRDTNPVRPEHLLLVFGITAVATFFMLTTLGFIGCLYRRLRGVITQNERSHE